jgi:acetyl-CoA acetyltransferase
VPTVDLSRQACVAGIGTSREFGLVLGRSPLRLQVEAFRAALADAGLEKSQVDGFATAHGAPHGVDYDEFAIQAGCDFRWVSQLWSHGRWASTLVAQSAMAVASGMADCVAVANTVTHGKGYGRHFHGLSGGGSWEAFRDVGGSHGEAGPYGLDTPGAATAMAAQRYMDTYGATSEDLAVAPLASRKHARLNPMAIMRDRELTLDEYLASPPLVGPFRIFDYCLRNEGSVCFLVTSVERARALAKAPALIAGFQGARASRDDFIMFARPGLGIGFTDEYEYRPQPAPVYAMAGVERGDVDGLYVYDSFSSNLWMLLERFGFCGEGEAFEWLKGGRIELGGELPVNTNGGLQSEAHLSGYGHLVEMVRQLRGEAGPRQIKNASVLQWATPWGDSVILTRE